MCSIHGIYFMNNIPLNECKQRLEKMLSATKHRGPDGNSIEILDRMGLSTGRLAIVGLDDKTILYTDDQKSKFILFNGEITNYRLLLSELKINVQTQPSDGSLILPLIQKYGQNEFVNHVYGMFAIALYDHSKRLLQLWRDPLGIKPLYYYHTKDLFIFSSEIKGIVSVLNQELEIDPSAIDNILRIRFHPGSITVFKDIKRVLPGQTIVFDGISLKKSFYWKIPPNNSNLKGDYLDKLNEYLNLFNQVLDEYNNADVKGGYFVSGGLDSSSVVSLSLRNKSNYLLPISMEFLNSPNIDSDYGRELEDYLQTQFDRVIITDQLAMQTLQELIPFLDEPLENPIHVGTYLMAKRAKELGIKTVLTGDGADEFFLGYERHRSWAQAGKILPHEEYEKWIRNFSSNQKKELYTLDFLNVTRDKDAEIQIIGKLNSFEDALLFEQGDRLPEYHCMRLDRMTMAHSVEARVPFLDRRIVEFAQEIPLNIRYGNVGKSFLRAALRNYLPKTIIERKKAHFPSSPDQWIFGNGVGWISEILLDPGSKTKDYFRKDILRRWITEHREGTNLRGRQLWALLILELWLNQEWT